MSEQDLEQQLDSSEENQQVQQTKKQTKKGGLIVVFMILISLILYLFADRYTPVTSQARIDGYVIGVAPDVAGRVVNVWVENNQEVEKGQRLFEIDPAQYQIALDKARSDLDNARRQVGAGDANVETARANLTAAKANEQKARKDFQRLQRLHKQDPGTVSVRRLEMSEASYASARASVTAAEASIRAAIEQMGGADIENNTILATAQTAVDKAELDLSHTLVTAKNRGVITDLRADIGQFASAGAPVLTLIPIHDAWINAEFTENNLGHMDIGTKVELLVDSLPGHVFLGTVDSIGLGVDDGNNTPAGTLPTIQNSRDWLRPSQRFPVIIRFDTEQSDILRGQIRIGGQITVIAYNDEDRPILNWLGECYIRLASWLSYAY